MIHLHTLGDTLITVGEKEVRPSSPMVFAALLYLGVERGRRVPRAALQEMFFPNADERSGSHSVRQLLYKLRQLGAPLTSDQSSVSISQSDVYDDCVVDNPLSWSNRDSANAALGFVPDYAPYFSDRFTGWIDQQRAAVSSRVRTALAEILTDRRSRANWTEVADVAQLLIGLDPLHEEATLALAEATAAAGSKQQALGLLSAYQAETGAALHLAPTLLRKRISSIREQPRNERQQTPLIGRSDEVATILARLSNPERYDARVNLVVGEPGIGKSRLLEELRKAMQLAGVRVFVAKCRPDHEHRPLGVFTTLVPELMQSPGALGVSPESLAQLRQLVQADVSDSPPMPPDDDVGRSEALRQALLDLVDAVAAEERLLLAVEDAHWCDSASLRELRTLASRVPSLRILVTSRSLDCLKAPFGDMGAVFRLNPLSAGHMDGLAVRLLCGRHETATRRWCVEVAAGNPLFLHMLCEHVIRTSSCTVPKDLKTFIASRIALLPGMHLRALQYVALLGENSSVESLRALLELPPAAFITCISNLEDHGFFTATDERFRLTHDLVNEVAQGLATPVTMKALHAHVASYLEQRFENSRNIATLWDCAEQWRLSGEQEKSITLVRRCAAHASSLGQSTRALELLSRAKSWTKDSHHLAQLLADMMLASKAAGQLTDVLTLDRELRALSHQEHADTELLVLEAEWLINGRLDPERLLSCVQPRAGSTQHRMEACLLLLRFAHEACDADLARKAYCSVADALPDAPTKERLLVQLLFHSAYGEAADAARSVEELLNAIPSFSHVADKFHAARNACVSLLVMGRVPEAIALADTYRQLAGDLGLHSREYEFKEYIAASYVVSQDFENGKRWLAELQSPPESQWVPLYRELKIELALADKNASVASRLLADLKQNDQGTMLRRQLFRCGAELRLNQLDSDYTCAPQEFAKLMQMHDATKRYISDDDFVRALAEDRRRQGKPAEGLAILDDYVVSSRRQRWVLPESFVRLRAELNDILREPTSALA